MQQTADHIITQALCIWLLLLMCASEDVLNTFYATLQKALSACPLGYFFPQWDNCVAKVDYKRSDFHIGAYFTLFPFIAFPCIHCAPMTGWVDMSTWAVCLRVSALYEQSATCVFWSANENLFLTDVALGRSNVLAQQCLTRQRRKSSARDSVGRRCMGC